MEANDATTIGRLLINAARDRPDQEAVIFPSDRLLTIDVMNGALAV